MYVCMYKVECVQFDFVAIVDPRSTKSKTHEY